MVVIQCPSHTGFTRSELILLALGIRFWEMRCMAGKLSQGERILSMIDWIECVTWTARARARVLEWFGKMLCATYMNRFAREETVMHPYHIQPCHAKVVDLVGECCSMPAGQDRQSHFFYKKTLYTYTLQSHNLGPNYTYSPQSVIILQWTGFNL